MRAPVRSEGVRGGVMLGVAAVVLGVAGLSPALTWIPEVPLLAAFVLVPVAILTMVGFRTGSRAGQVMAGALAGALAGAIGGVAGGSTYVAFGKPIVNIAAGAIAGSIFGGLFGAVGALLAIRRARRGAYRR